ncbi:copper chaperone PCu(A)C [Pseudonocardia hierapolitana]|uniref:copper chaperone PCu(A)C n=1 Tax=Pseudonocardia hierapolitana TaxID=1128676 RepID=UPI0014790ECB|nr:copper chaperone PCu(A)C [Pseudonocardia hierapolitana]
MSDPRRNRAQLVIGALIAAVAVAGCGAGQITQTSRQVAAVEGANATSNQISVRNAMIEFDEPAHGAAIYPVGGSAPLQMVIVNTGAELDRLVAASSPVASSVEISGVLRIPGGQALTIEGAPAAAPAPAEGAPPATPGATPSQTAAPAPPTSAPAAAEPAPAAQPSAAEGESGAGHIVLTGLREDVQAGLTYPLILTFERAGEVRFDVPVANPETLREDAAH